MGFLLEFFLGTLFGFFADLFWWLIPDEIQRRNDRKRLLEGEVRCAIRAGKGRVLNIGTEWSVGIAQVSPGLLHFTPAIGIVGSREVRVLGIRDRDRSIAPSPLERPVGDWLDFIVTTAAGELVVRFPLEVGDAAAVMVRP
ncbi:hypothetical protein [Microcella sp.]|uniref:hypothetical protein n=1 Tax=Microcella sp. TaxID=1913979 RepID=UPI00256D9DAE|nr:hypothetical protein [Microcella sp.]MBX9471397.1 hypothetical protein [Microcella sp.]